MTRIAAFGCIHAPFTPVKSWRAMIGQLRDYKPDVVVNTGDWFEASAASVHARDSKTPLADEYDMAVEQSREIRSAAGKAARLIWCLGNHDDNLQAPDERRIPKELRGIAHWNTYSDEFHNWKQIPYKQDRKGSWRCGPVVFSHGHKASKHSDKQEALLRARDWNRWKILSVRSHTHRPVDPHEHHDAQGIFYMNVGTMGPLNPDWADRVDTRRWAPALGLIEVDRGNFDARLVRL